MSTSEERKEALKQISALVSEAAEKLREAQGIADEAKVSFRFSPAYGMGGTYIPDTEDGVYYDGDWEESDSEYSGSWKSSSAMC